MSRNSIWRMGMSNVDFPRYLTTTNREQNVLSTSYTRTTPLQSSDTGQLKPSKHTATDRRRKTFRKEDTHAINTHVSKMHPLSHSITHSNIIMTAVKYTIPILPSNSTNHYP